MNTKAVSMPAEQAIKPENSSLPLSNCKVLYGPASWHDTASDNEPLFMIHNVGHGIEKQNFAAL